LNIFRLKNASEVREESSHSSLKKSLTAFDLIILGIGAVIGTGIFVITGPASQYSGPALALSFLLGGFICMFVALVYTEIASMIPTSGSVYTYSYVALGEVTAWITAMLIVIEFGVGASAVAAGWSGYVVSLLKTGGVYLPTIYTSSPFHGGMINLPAIFITLFVTYIVIRGTKESAIINTILVAIKLLAIFIFVVVAVPHFDLANWDPFAPFGFPGIATGAAMVFLAFTGFDSLAAASEECKNPKRDIIIGLGGSLLISTIVYMIVAAVLTGIVPFTELNNAKPLAHALSLNGSHVGSALVAVGGIAGMTTVLIVNCFALSRVFYVMARDALLPEAFTKIHSRYGTPYVSSIVAGCFIAVVAGFLPIHILGSLASLGTLIVFLIASIVVIVLRYKMPDAERPFKCPAIFVISPIAISSCGYLILQLFPTVGIYCLGWVGASLIFYFLYSIRNSAKHNRLEEI
jgi:APA family basic amino acid/polyamine antiporter